MLPKFNIEMPSSFAGNKVLQAVHQARFRRLVTSLRDGGLSLSSMHEEGPLVIERRDYDIGLVIS